MKRERRPHDEKAPDGYVVCGLRRVRSDGTLKFHHVRWQCPKGWEGQDVWVHITDPITLDTIEAAPPGQDYFICDWRDRVLLYPSPEDTSPGRVADS